jgi:hypothetical protein
MVEEQTSKFEVVNGVFGVITLPGALSCLLDCDEREAQQLCFGG